MFATTTSSVRYDLDVDLGLVVITTKNCASSMDVFPTSNDQIFSMLWFDDNVSGEDHSGLNRRQGGHGFC